MFRYWTKRTNKNSYLRLDGPSKFKEIDSRELQNVHLKWNRKQRKQVLFRVVVSLHPPGGNIFVLSRNSTATLQQMCPWLLERLPVNHSELFESLNFESVQDVKAKFPHNPILHYASIYGALLFSVCACIMNKGVSFLRNCGAASAEIFYGITFWRSLETRLNSVAKPTEFVPKPFLACVTFFVTLENTRNFGE